MPGTAWTAGTAWTVQTAKEENGMREAGRISGYMKRMTATAMVVLMLLPVMVMPLQAASGAGRKNTAVQVTQETVYIAASGNGTKYHSDPNCSRMKKTISMTVEEAEAQGYTPCKKCYR